MAEMKVLREIPPDEKQKNAVADQNNAAHTGNKIEKAWENDENEFIIEREKQEEIYLEQNVKTFSSLDISEREFQYEKLEFLLKKSSTYTSFVLNRIERQKEDERKRAERKEKKEKKATLENKEPAVEKRGGLREKTLSPLQGKRKASPATKIPKAKRRRKAEEIVEDEEEDEVESLSSSQESEQPAVREGHPVLFTGGTLRSYQTEGYKWLLCLYENAINGILADEMGLGKTIQCIALIAELCANGVLGPFLVVAPLSTLPNWVAEFERFAPTIPVVLYHGTKEHRTQLRRRIKKRQEVTKVGKLIAPVVITSYEVIMNDRTALENMPWKYLIVDEGHRIKNIKCRLIKELKQITSSHRLLLTGTPLQNNLAELWALLNFILPEIFDSLESFQMWFDAGTLGSSDNHEAIIEEEKRNNVLSMLHQILSPFLLRRIKSDIDLNLPPKRELLVYAPLVEEQAHLYRAAMDNTIENLVKDKKIEEETDGVPRGRGHRTKNVVNYQSMLENGKEDKDDVLSWCESFLDEGPKSSVTTKKNLKKSPKSDIHLQLSNKMMLLRRICNHPYLISYPLTDEGQFKVDEKLITSCGKLKLFDQMVTELRKRKHKILVFSQMTSMLDILHDYCYYRDYQFSRLDGSMDVLRRKEEMDKFNKDPDCGIFLLSTRAGGLGINLVAADTCIIYDSDWNPQADLQAQDRCHRIGQTKPVLIFRLVTAKTIDQEIVERAAAKRKLEKMIIVKGRFKSGIENFGGKMSLMNSDDLRELLVSTDHDVQLDASDTKKVLSAKDLRQLLDRSVMMKKWQARRKGAEKAARSESTEGVEGVFKVLEEDEDEMKSGMGAVKS